MKNKFEQIAFYLYYCDGTAFLHHQRNCRLPHTKRACPLLQQQPRQTLSYPYRTVSNERPFLLWLPVTWHLSLSRQGRLVTAEATQANFHYSSLGFALS